MKAFSVGNLAAIKAADFEGRLWSADLVGNTFAAKAADEISSVHITITKRLILPPGHGAYTRAVLMQGIRVLILMDHSQQ